jgi:hypothetical protein
LNGQEGADEALSPSYYGKGSRLDRNLWQDDENIKAGLTALKELQARNNKLALKAPEIISPLSSLDYNGHDLPETETVRHGSIPIEQDFTTQGKQGDLKCPFASNPALRRRQISRQMSSTILQSGRQNNQGASSQTERWLLDPICAEVHAAEIGSSPPSVTGTSKCPIRFLDHHSPEEVAEYFENHKHEIPRSHEICVKRYQTNEESIRQLDAKYGSLVSMIQGLGLKHQPILATKERDTSDIIELESIDKVRRWATACSDNITAPVDENNEDLSETRMGIFDRPLKEIRVGESPSRPWGIQVPYVEELALSTRSEDLPEAEPVSSIQLSQSCNDQKPEDVPVPTIELGRCPFGHDKAKAGSAEGLVKASSSPRTESRGTRSRSASKHGSYKSRQPSRMSTRGKGKPEQPRMMFTGPVFIGYTTEQVSELLHNFPQSTSI